MSEKIHESRKFCETNGISQKVHPGTKRWILKSLLTFFARNQKKLTVGGQQLFIVISFTWKNFFHVTKFLWQKKCNFEGPADQKYAESLETFLSKSEKKFEKKYWWKIFLSESPRDTWKKGFPTNIIFFSKVQTISLKIRIYLWKKKQENNFFLRNCLWTYKIFYLKSCHFFMEIAQKFTQSLRKTIKITCFLKTCVFPQNFPPDSQNAFLTNLPEKTYQNCENIGLRVQKKLRN